MGEGGFRCSLNLSEKVLADSPIYSSSHSTLECLVSYDVEALFTSVPIQAALNITKKKLEEDKELHLRTSMSVQHISWLLEFCLRTTYFLVQGEFYQQLEGTAMGSPISPIIANLFLEDLETKALSSSPHPPSMWKRYVDDTLTIINRDHKDAFSGPP